MSLQYPAEAKTVLPQYNQYIAGIDNVEVTYLPVGSLPTVAWNIETKTLLFGIANNSTSLTDISENLDELLIVEANIADILINATNITNINTNATNIDKIIHLSDNIETVLTNVEVQALIDSTIDTTVGTIAEFEAGLI